MQSELVEMKSKVTEVGIFAIGVGIVIATLTTFLVVQSTPPVANPQRNIAIGISMGSVYVILGVLVIAIRRKALIWTAVSVFGLLLLADVSMGFNVVKLLFSTGIFAVLYRGAKQAIFELEQSEAAHGDEAGSR